MGLTMDVYFPELTSFGTLLKFSLALEEAATALYTEAARLAADTPVQQLLEGSSQRHARRGQQLEQLRRERLNEVVLQPISGMLREQYLPVQQVPDSLEQALGGLIDLEHKSSRFFDDAAVVAANVLGGVERVFTRLARDNRALGEQVPRQTG
ncbi:MAG: hypothetical protein JW797_01630 [Bradymonadales bacterium]|nr:hypothetical protein [Bradymonadales bacterium]